MATPPKRPTARQKLSAMDDPVLICTACHAVIADLKIAGGQVEFANGAQSVEHACPVLAGPWSIASAAITHRGCAVAHAEPITPPEAERFE